MLIIAIIFPFHFQTVFSAVDGIRPSQSISDGKTLVSKEAMFEFGFFSLGNSKSRYVGIWYKNIPITIVWVANRCKPINNSSGLLTINSTGNLVLLYQNKSVAWSTSASKQAKKPLVELLDSGNLVLRDEEDKNSENYLWQSFDYPCDTLIAGMKIGRDLRTGRNLRLSAWKNWDDPCPGDFTYGLEFDQKLNTYPEFYLRKGNAKCYRSGPWNGIRFSGGVEQRPNPYFSFESVYSDDEVYYGFNLKNKSLISILAVNQTTSLRQRLTWIKADQAWKPYSNSPRDDCDKYRHCGANANCDMKENPICECLKGFKPTSPETWSLMDWSKGCVRNKPMSSLEKGKDGFIKFPGLKVPDTTHSWVNKSMNTKECRAKCLSSSSCMAYTNTDIRGQGSGCALWFGDLIDIRQFPQGGQDLFIRMPSSELGKTARNIETICQHGGQEEDLELPLFNLSSIIVATENFSPYNKLGEGGFGPVYRGKLEDGQEIAVKRLSINSAQGVYELKNEVKLIAKLQHRNLVKLLGCCIQGEEKLLVYEYMPNKSLDFFIFDQKQGKLFEWSKRLQIICGIARGLLYLHQDSRLRVIHRDLKASNVLLDNDMNPKISDFGLARIFGGDQTEEQTNRVIGTYGYMAPEYAFDGLFSVKSDVFSFGILVLEIVSGKKSRGFHHQNHGVTLIGHAWKLHKEGNSIEMFDKHLREADNNVEQVLRCIHVGLLCVQQSPVDRPNMSSVVVMLGSESELPQPKPPGYFVEMDLAKGGHSSTNPESSSMNDMSISLLDAR
ncbi:G-type lectin S-receptor-like serine/threonine-protein kinase At4g27290 isoform X2 [Morus notabilis]|uniref:G-type lectin S-receptor-like serine/threonine-protein kinase At4g27290 isoform X2 n=1 Tax=Morus notabilis TaxID=981085 RepID=UPI000CED11DD|nr:G-type lectin S-receptor-like serine/threonine-protein kinase At4g27290 isoform X2 [Morus notabilis]